MLLTNKNAVIYGGGGAHFLDVVVSESSTALTREDVDGWRKRQPRAAEFQPSVLAHKGGGCARVGTERNQRCC